MSTQYDSTGPLTAEQAASINFEPWPGEPKDIITDAGRGAMESNRVTILFATVLMYKTKAELITWIRENDEEACCLMERIYQAQDSLQAAMDLLGGAEARLICTGANLELEA